MKLPIHRQFEVDYQEKDAGTWTATAHLRDEVHDISVRVDVAVPELVIREAEFAIAAGPVEECRLVRERAGVLRGLELRGDFPRKLSSLLMGPQGCSNVFLLLSLSLPPLARFYFPFIEAQRRGTTLDERDACLAHAVRGRAADSRAEG